MSADMLARARSFLETGLGYYGDQIDIETSAKDLAAVLAEVAEEARCEERETYEGATCGEP